jgi:hypothetical protein
MTASTPSSISRYRPAILTLLGVSAAYAIWQVYTNTTNPPPSGLHRSNAVRRGPARTNRSRQPNSAPNGEEDAAPLVDGAENVAPTEVSWGSDEDTEGGIVDAAGQTLQRTLYHIAEDRARYAFLQSLCW